MSSNLNFQEALKLFTVDGRGALDAQQAANFSSLFAPTSEDEVLTQFGNSELDEQQLRSLVDNLNQSAPSQDELLSLLNRINTGRSETISKNTLYHIFKNSNRITDNQFDEFLNHLGLNSPQINIKQFVHKLTSMYQ